jgi:predicted ATPase/DNA-binding SARP family transcriptional activator
VWWVDLAPLPPDADPAPAVAAVLGVRHPAGANEPGVLADILASALSGPSGAPRRLLLVLDNCEHVVDGAAALADLLLRRCPGLTLLATSREALGVEGETVWPVAGLAHPPVDAGPADPDRGGAVAGRAPEAFAAMVAGYEAAALFVERARAVQPGFALTAQTAPHVAAICARLDGLPLALELAAAQVATLGIEQLAARLDDVLAVLTRGRRTALPRHRTLRALLDWSYHLLAPAERAVLARLSVFRRIFTLEHAEFVCAPPDGVDAGGQGHAPDLVGAFGRLVEQSLVDVREAGPGDGGEPRYRLLEPVRQYAAALLAGTPDQSRTRDRHLEWAAALAARAEPGLVSHERRAALRLLRQQLDDVRAAVRWAGEAPLDAGSEARARWALQIAGCLTNFWVSAGAWEDGWQLFEQALHAALRAGLVTPHGAAVEARPPDVLVVSEALWAGGGMALLTGRRDRAAELAGAAQAMFAAHHEQTPAQSPERAEAARRLALAHLTVFEIQISRGELAAARHTLDVGTAVADASGDARARVLMRARGPVLQVVAGDLAGAAAACAEAVPPLRGLGDLTFLAATLQLAADVARERGDVRAALAYAVESAAVFAEEPDPWFVSRALEQCAAACAAAAPAPADGVAPGLQPPAAPPALAAARLLGAAAALRRRTGVALVHLDQATHARAQALAVASLGAAAFAAAHAEGERLGSAEAIALAEEAAGVLGTVGAEAVGAEAVHPSHPAPVSAGTSAGAGEIAAIGGAPGGQTRPPSAERASVRTPREAVPVAALEVRAFGPLQVMRAGVAVPPGELTPAKVRELLLYLALHPEGRTKEQAALALWPDASPAQVRSAFHVTMHQLRRALGRKDAVAFDGGAYALARGTAALLDRAHAGAPIDRAPVGGAAADAEADGAVVRTDVDAVLTAAEAVRAADRAADRARAQSADAVAAAGADTAARARWRAALARAGRGALGEGEGAGEWLAGPAGRVGAAWAEAMEALARLAVRAGAAGEAAAVLEALVAAEPLREGAHRMLMAAYVTAGEPARALAHYDALAARVARAVGAAPGRETRALAATIRGGAGRTL